MQRIVYGKVRLPASSGSICGTDGLRLRNEQVTFSLRRVLRSQVLPPSTERDESGLVTGVFSLCLVNVETPDVSEARFKRLGPSALISE